MQAFGVISFLFCVICMFLVLRGWNEAGFIVFVISITAFMVSLILSLVEISVSMRALELALRDMEAITRTDFLGRLRQREGKGN